MNNRDKFTALRSRIKQFGKRELALVTKTLTTAGVFCMAGYMAVSMGQFAHRVTITCDGQPMQITTFRNDAASILAQSRVEYDDTHEILCRYNDGNLVEIIVNSAPDVTVVADGVSYPVAIHNGTVADALCFAGVTLGEMDAADHALTDPLTDDMVIRVQRVEKVVTTETVVIEHGTEEVKSALYKKGTRKVVRKGKDGKKEVTTTHIYVDGVLTSSEIEETVIKAPTDEKVMVGAKVGEVISPLQFDDLELDENGYPVNYSQKIVGTATAYGIMDGTKTSTGMGPGVGYIAVNPDVIPYGSRLYIRSPKGGVIYGCAIAADCGPSVLQNITVADLFMETSHEIYMFGRRTVEIYILD